MNIEEKNLPTDDEDDDEDFDEEADQFLRDLDAICSDDFYDADFNAGREAVRPIGELEEVVLGLEALNAAHQARRLEGADLDDLEDLEDELGIVANSFYGRSMVSRANSLLARAERARQGLYSPPAWAEKKAETPGEKALALLRENGYYAVGIPHQIDTLEQPYNRTLDIVMLVTELMQREGKPVCLLVANMPTNTRTTEEARLIGLKDLIFYEALQDLLLEMAPPQGKPFQRLPVVLMSEVDQLPGFAERRLEVGKLFETNSDFREAAYACVPTQLRHRKHHGKTYAQLEAMTNKAPLEVALAKIPYVLDQISKVSSIGGKKWGHKREKPYDEATALAEQLLEQDEVNRTEFECIKPGGSMGEVPYRAAAGLKDPKDIPGLLTSYGRIENYMDALNAFAADRRVPIDRINAELTRAEHALAEAQGEVPPDPDTIGFADAWRAKLLDVIRRMVGNYALSILEEHERLRGPVQVLDEFLMALRGKFMDQLLRNPRISEPDRVMVEMAYMMQTEKETYLAKASGAIVKDYVLMKRMNIFAVLREEAPQSSIAEQSGKWIPFAARPPAGELSYAYVPFIVSGLLFGTGAPYEHRANHADDILAAESRGRWTLPYPIFEKLLFSSKKLPGPPETSADVTAALDSLIETPEKVRWRSFDEFIDAIEGTPVETFYHAWLNQFSGTAVPDLEPLPPEFVRSEQAARIVKILERPCFSEPFRNDFLFILSCQ